MAFGERSPSGIVEIAVAQTRRMFCTQRCFWQAWRAFRRALAKGQLEDILEVNRVRSSFPRRGSFITVTTALINWATKRSVVTAKSSLAAAINPHRQFELYVSSIALRGILFRRFFDITK
jgi:hypothetical protein